MARSRDHSQARNESAADAPPAAQSTSILPPVVYGNTTDAVTDALREEILSGTLAPNTWIREHDIAKRFSVSRTPIREAMRRLADEGLTQRSANQGTMVAPMSLDDILAVYAVRETLEGLAARSAAARRPDGLVEALSEIHQQMEGAQGDIAKLAALNLRFHGILRDASNNSYLERFLTQVEYAVRRFGKSTYDTPGREQEALQEHYAIIEAIAAGDAATAEARAVEHMRRAREVRLSQMLRQRFNYEGTAAGELDTLNH
jgi:DNA-binding GntR family transcriptional regulator